MKNDRPTVKKQEEIFQNFYLHARGYYSKLPFSSRKCSVSNKTGMTDKGNGRVGSMKKNFPPDF